MRGVKPAHDNQVGGKSAGKSSIAGTAGRASVSCRLRRLQASPRRRRLRPRSAENAVAQRYFAAHSGPGRLLPLRRAAHRSVAGKLPRRWSTGTRPAPLRSATTIAESSSSRSGSSVAATLEIGAYAMRRRREVWRVGAVGPIGVGEIASMVMRISVVSVKVRPIPVVVAIMMTP